VRKSGIDLRMGAIPMKNNWTQLGRDVVRLRHEGKTHKEICIQLRVTPHALKGFLRRLVDLPKRAARVRQPQPPRRRPQAMTEAQIAQLAGLWAAGHAASAISRQMNVTKNVIIGKVHRLGLPGRPSPIRSGIRSVAPSELPVKPQPAAPVEPPAAPAPYLRIVPKPKHNFTRTCCWPIGEPGTNSFRFCDDADVVEGKPYCLEHCRRAYVNFERGSAQHAA
jgi:GcrA cell cycle regulator